MRKLLAAGVSILMIVAMMYAIGGGAGADAAAAPIAPIRKAYSSLRRAHYVLEHSCRRLGGYRDKALAEVTAAISELQAAAATQQATLPQAAESGAMSAPAGQLHPYIHDALRRCREAKTQLASTTQNFGGHRATAAQHVDNAIADLQQALTEPACH